MEIRLRLRSTRWGKLDDGCSGGGLVEESGSVWSSGEPRGGSGAFGLFDFGMLTELMCVDVNTWRARDYGRRCDLQSWNQGRYHGGI